MLIDWFTVAAQLINFLILVYLLKRFLYKPIVRHMNEREATIRQRLQDAAEKRAEAEEQIETFRRKCNELDAARDQKMEQAEQDATQRRQELLDQARRETEEERHRWLKSLEKDQAAFALEWKQRSSQKILRLARRALQDLGDASLNDRLATVLLDRLDHLDKRTRANLAKAGKEQVTVRSSFELDQNVKRRITLALHDLCGKQATIDYQVDAEYPLGIEASAGSTRLSWGIENYFDGLQQQVADLLGESLASAQLPQQENGNKESG